LSYTYLPLNVWNLKRTCHFQFPSIDIHEKEKIKTILPYQQTKNTKERRKPPPIAATIENKWSVYAIDCNEIDMTLNTRHLSILDQKRTAAMILIVVVSHPEEFKSLTFQKKTKRNQWYCHRQIILDSIRKTNEKKRWWWSLLDHFRWPNHLWLSWFHTWHISRK
jgi:hypothetical protein